METESNESGKSTNNIFNRKVMKEQKQKIYIIMFSGLVVFITLILLLVSNSFSTINKKFEIDQLNIANITTQSAQIFWKGYSKDGFSLMYKEISDSGIYKEIIPTQIFEDTLYDGYVYKVDLNELTPNTAYSLEVWGNGELISEHKLTTQSVAAEIMAPEPMSGQSFPFDWIKITDNSRTYITRAGSDGSWSLDKNLISDPYYVEVYSSLTVKEDNIVSKYFNNVAYAAEVANCDEISYGGVASDIKEKSDSIQNILATLQGGGGGNPQYKRCYEDVYCEAEKAGVNPRWTLADWTHESNASDYEFPKGSLYEDFGVHCCGVPSQNYQAQLGFFLNLSHDPCGCNGSCSKEEYYCCWANNYLYGNQTKSCTDGTWAYLNSLITYYNMVGKGIYSVSDLPMPLKTAGKNVSCGAQDPISIYKDIINGGGDDGGDSGGDEDDDTQNESGGICCALKITGKDAFQGDYESSGSDCMDIWEGKKVYGGTVEYAVKLSSQTRGSCEKQWTASCCNTSNGYEWLPSNQCSDKVSEYTTYDTCMEAGGEKVNINLTLDKGYNFTSWIVNSASPLMASDLLNNSSIILVGGFHNGAWDELMYKESGTKGSDFELVAGQSYLITTTKSTQIELNGVMTDIFNWDTLKGWQFVPAYSVKPFTNTKDVVLSFEDADISQIALWSNDLGKFNYFVYDVTGEDYGESVKFRDSQGIFVKID